MRRLMLMFNADAVAQVTLRLKVTMQHIAAGGGWNCSCCSQLLMSLYVTSLLLLALEAALQAPAECHKSLKLNGAASAQDQVGTLPLCCAVVVAAIEVGS